MACAADVECPVLYPCLLLLYLHELKTRAKLYAQWEIYTWTTNNIDRRKLNRILNLFHIISYIIFFASFLYFHVHFLSCSYIVHVSYTFISRILSYNLSYTVLYFYLHSYTFHIRYFCILSSVFHLFLVFFIFQFYDLLHSMYYYIYHFLSCTYIMSPFM